MMPEMYLNSGGEFYLCSMFYVLEAKMEESTIETKEIPKSNGCVMAPYGRPNIFIEGKPRNIFIIKKTEGKDIPPSVRNALVGMTIPVIFSSEEINKYLIAENKVVEDCLWGYASEIFEILKTKGKDDEANKLLLKVQNPLAMIGFKKGTYCELL